MERDYASKRAERKMKKNEQNFRKIWGTIKHTNICMMGEPEGKKKRGEPKKYLKK